MSIDWGLPTDVETKLKELDSNQSFDYLAKDFYNFYQAVGAAITPTAAAAVDLGDDTPFTTKTFLYVGVEGDIVVDGWGTLGGTAITLKSAFGEMSGPVSKIYSTANGTTATDIVAFQ